MPGLVGFTDKRHEHDSNMLLNMRRLLKHFDWYVDEESYFDEHVYASRTHLGILNQGKQPYVYKNRFFSWLEGEFYDQKELKSRYNVASSTDNELLVSIYRSTRSFNFLREIDGYYASVLYDKEKGKLHLITDRYGFKPLYWGLVGDGLVWSSEVKGFLGHDGFRPAIDRQAVKEFFLVGYLLENRSWFEGVELVPPASVLTFDIRTRTVDIRRYWSWHHVERMKGPVDQRQFVEELGRLFKQAVCQRMSIRERIGINLSGGLDSRAILAATPESYKPLHTFTFGQKGCQDLKIASKVSGIKGARHHALYMDSNNWLLPRVSQVWKADGTNLMHMHQVPFLNEQKSYIDVGLNGFAGDLVLGGSYLREYNLDTKIDSSIATKIGQIEIGDGDFSDWYTIQKTDPYFINNRVRRFTNSGPISTGKLIEPRFPFWGNKLIELVYSVPDILRYKNHIYAKMLLSAFPDYYHNIPWQKTGCPISYPQKLVKLITLKNRAANKLRRHLQRCGLSQKDLTYYADYPLWIRQDPAMSFFEKVLLSKSVLFADYIDKNEIRSALRGHMTGRHDCSNRLCLALTFELWLQQVFEGRYRSFLNESRDHTDKEYTRIAFTQLR
jgi:asparagine synthase (glutamine-hydrolysing)